MGLRDKVRKGVRKRLRKGRAERSTDAQDSGEMRRRLAQLRARAAQLEVEVESPETSEDQRVKDQFRRAERTATVGAPVQATLDPIAPPQQMREVAQAGQADDRETLADFAVRSGDREPDDRPEIEEMAMLDFGIDDDPDDRDDGGFYL